MKVYRIKPGDLNACTERDPKALLVWFADAEPGDSFTVDVSEMTEAEYDALPEYMGP